MNEMIEWISKNSDVVNKDHCLGSHAGVMRVYAVCMCNVHLFVCVSHPCVCLCLCACACVWCCTLVPFVAFVLCCSVL